MNQSAGIVISRASLLAVQIVIDPDFTTINNFVLIAKIIIKPECGFFLSIHPVCPVKSFHVAGSTVLHQYCLTSHRHLSLFHSLTCGAFGRVCRWSCRQAFESCVVMSEFSSKQSVFFQFEGRSGGSDLLAVLFEAEDAVKLLVDCERKRVLNANRAACEFYGYTRDQLKELSYADFDLSPGERGCQQLRQSVKEGKYLLGMHRRRNCEDPCPVMVKAVAAEFESRTILLVSVRPISSESNLSIDSLLREALMQAPEPVLITDLDGTIQFVNHAFEQCLGYKGADVAGQTPRILRSGLHGKEEYEALWETIKSGQVWKGRLKNRCKNGTLIEEDIQIAPIRDEHERITHFISMRRDMTEYYELQAQLHQAQKMDAVGRLANGMIHDMNNMITAVQGFAGMLREENPLSARQQACLDQIDTAIGHAARLNESLRAFGREDAEAPVLIDPKSFVAEQQKLLIPLLGADCKLECYCAESLGMFRANDSQMSQAIVNLVLNARDAIAGIGRIYLEARLCRLDSPRRSLLGTLEPEDYVTLSVADNGHGMDKETRGRIFEPFFTTRENGNHAGLGLTMVYGIVRQAGGHLFIRSEPGEGTCVDLYFPCVSPSGLADGATGAGKEDQASVQGICVLVVEDDPAVLNLVDHILKSKGHRVLTATNGREGLAVAREHLDKIQLLISDIVMPELSGLDLAKMLLECRSDLAVLLISGYPDNHFNDPLIDEGQFGFLSKPFKTQELLSQVDALVRNHSA